MILLIKKVNSRCNKRLFFCMNGLISYDKTTIMLPFTRNIDLSFKTVLNKNQLNVILQT